MAKPVRAVRASSSSASSPGASLGASPRRSWRAAALVLVVAAVYANGLDGPFVLDDQGSVVQNADIRDLSDLHRVLLPASNSSVAGRPLASLSFALNYAWGGLDVTGYHLVNVALHALCALLLFYLLRRVLAITVTAPNGAPAGGAAADAARSDTAAFAAALLWAVHPLNSEVVNYLTQRTESLMAVCVLATLYASLRAASSRRPWWSAAAIATSVLAMASKETAVVTPILVLLFDRAFLFADVRTALRHRWRLYTGLAGTWIVLLGLVVSGPRAAVGGLDAGVAVGTYLANQAVMIVGYLRLAVWPTGLVVFYGWPLPLTVADVAGPGLVIVALLGVAIWGWFRAPRWGFWGLWFFATLAPTSSVVPIATEVGAERRMYLPMVAVAVLVVTAVRALAARVVPNGRHRPELQRHNRGGLIAGALLWLAALPLAAATWVRTAEYQSGLSLAQTLVARRATPIARHILGEQLMLAGQMDAAIAELRRSVAGGNTRARYQLGMALLDRKRDDEAAEAFEAFVATAGVRPQQRWLEPPVIELLNARVALAQLHADARRWVEAEAQARAVLRVAPAHRDARRALSMALFGQQRWPEAIESYRLQLQRTPDEAPAWMNLGVALVATGRLDDAVDAFRRAVTLDPANPSTRRLLNMAIEDAARF